MSIKEYNFQEFTDKSMFEMRLAGTIPDFGYISCTKRKLFFDFCVKNGFISKYATTSDNSAVLCNVDISFRFSGMLEYRPKPIIMAAGVSMAIVHDNFKMVNTGLDK